jgi:hypothetical protein
MTLAISPRYTLAKLEGERLEDMIDVFEDQMRGWLIEPANALRYYQHAGFGILAIVLSYFEPIGQFLEGKADVSKRQFVVGLKAVFPGIDPTIPDTLFHELYDQVRCGIFHQGITKRKVMIRPQGPHPIEVIYGAGHVVTQVEIVPINLIDSINNHLVRYVADLRNPENQDLRSNFRNWFVARGG